MYSDQVLAFCFPLSAKTTECTYLKLSQEKSPLISELPLVGFQQDLCCDRLNKQQVFFIIYKKQSAKK